MTDALVRMTQAQVFDLMMNGEEQGKDLEAMPPQFTLAFGRLTQASMRQKQWQVEFREKAKAAADEVEKLAKKGGLSDEAAGEIRRKILGVAG